MAADIQSLAQTGTFGLDQRAIERLFPFHLLIGRALEIGAIGPALRRIIPGLAVGDSLGSHFTITRPPAVAGFADIVHRQDVLFLVAARSRPDLVLKGQMLALDGATRLAFLCSPWITDLDSMRRLGF